MQQLLFVLKKPQTVAAVFFVLLIAMMGNIGLQKAIPLRPQSIHQWAQCDRASVALNYALKRTAFFKPMVHECSNGSGISGMELPVINYGASVLYQLFGYHEAYYRIWVMLIAFAGIVAAFCLARLFLNPWWALAAVLLFIQSPVLLYYMPNFLPDAASLGLSLIAWWLFFKIINKKSSTLLIWFFLIVSLASLIKVTALINSITMLLFVVMQNHKGGWRFILANKVICALAVSIIITVAWYAYARWLSVQYHSYYFLMAPHYPNSFADAYQTWLRIKTGMLNEYYTVVLGYILLAGTVALALNFKKAHRQLLIVTVTLYVGSILFFMLMLNQFVYHDYYFIALMPAVLFHLLLIASMTQKLNFKMQLGIAVIIIVSANYGMNICKKNFASRYNEQSWYYNNAKSKAYFNFENVLRENGIASDEKILSFTDETPNTSLYLINQRGISLSADTNLWQPYLNAGYKYAVINDSMWLHTGLQAFLDKQLACKNGLYLYALKPKQ